MEEGNKVPREGRREEVWEEQASKQPNWFTADAEIPALLLSIFPKRQ